MNPVLKNCKCMKCGEVWQDFPGAFAVVTNWKPDDPRDGCRNCGSLYWEEKEIVE